MPVPLVLASASPARLATLRSAGIEPRVVASHVDEDAVLDAARSANPALNAAEATLALARAKAEEVASAHSPGALVLGCDSMLEFDGEWLGKPGDAATARDRWRAMRGRAGVLHTGHWLVDARVPGASAEVGETASTTVWFADLSDAEVDAYVATGEPLAVAGAFTIDGLGGPFVERIDGDHHTVTGLSLPLLRHLCASLGVGIPELWSRPGFVGSPQPTET
jgi:septum formation protein